MPDKLVLAYHAVAPGWDSSLAVTPQALRSQLDYLLEEGYIAVTFTDLVSRDHDRDVFAATFDDAYLSVHDLARPLFEELDVVGTVFVPTKFPLHDGPMSWPGIQNWLGTEAESELRCMSWEHAAALADEGWEIGSHTRTHPRLTELDDRDLAQELEVSRETCARALGRPCTSIAYPYGDLNARVTAAAGEAGYIAGAGMPGPYLRANPLQFPRVGIYPADDMTRFRRKINPRVRRLRTSRIWDVALQARGRRRS